MPWLLPLMGAGLVAAGVFNLLALPRTYDRLEHRGVSVSAHADCGREDCELTYTYRGRTRTNRYTKDRRQFVCDSCPVSVLVDPGDPATMYTEHDVAARTGAGLGGGDAIIEFIFGGVLLLLGLGARRGERLILVRPRTVDPAGTLDRLASLVDTCRAVPGRRWFWPSRDLRKEAELIPGLRDALANTNRIGLVPTAPVLAAITASRRGLPVPPPQSIALSNPAPIDERVARALSAIDALDRALAHRYLREEVPDALERTSVAVGDLPHRNSAIDAALAAVEVAGRRERRDRLHELRLAITHTEFGGV